MRLKTTDLRARVNAPLVLRFQASGLTSYAGLELIQRYWNRIGLRELVGRHVTASLPGTDYGATSVILLLLTLIIVGGRRVLHLGVARARSARASDLWLGEDSDGAYGRTLAGADPHA